MLVQTAQGTAPDGLPYHVFTLSNSNGMSIQIMDWGATWITCQVPVQTELREVLVGCKLEDYPFQDAYLGATVGRYANRIAGSDFHLNGKQISLKANQGVHHLHGGMVGFDKQRWRVGQCSENAVSFMLFSPDGDQGFQGNVEVVVTYTLTEDNCVELVFDAISDKDTPLNLTNHAYFNLVNAEQGVDIRSHFLCLHADYYLPVDKEGIPNAPLKYVQQTSFDFRTEKKLAQDFLQDEQIAVNGYDHAFLLNKQQDVPCAILTAPDRRLQLQMFTSQPALQVYTGNFLAGTPRRHGGVYQNYAGIALESQALPDTPNHQEWWLLGGMSQANEKYHHWTKFKFL
ncbi:galactose-1-epimerase [Pasteurella sp. PK-2025]|uniref:galactose-1-epimerase n=1 Tax=Pasteurella sp. PK-2025 TaxID=3413133 RepID=UPI003C7904B3